MTKVEIDRRPSLNNVLITSPTRPVPGYLATPLGAGPWPGVVVIHDVLGMSRDLRDQVDWLAGAGYLTVAPDLFGRRNRVACMISVMRDVRAQRGRTYDDIAAARAWLIDRSDCTGEVGVIGFCLGGGLALMMAPGHGFGAASVNYGTAAKEFYSPDFLRSACPIVGSYGGRDSTMRGVADRLDRVLTEVGVEHDVKEYPDAGHEFLNDHERAGDPSPLLFRVLGKLTPGDGYHPESARDARRRIVAFFDAHLKPKGSAPQADSEHPVQMAEAPSPNATRSAGAQGSDEPSN
ncbi:carboxymethylenebutenolidase [Nakamurella panacisegetis]|uniref:Carboxymethylenebutenolidase n=1 Tax=Nakamurella panacisegetis TaxID=1090615 RepID=A0A1H0LTN6_9ACTN|nr:dienelactone hydrolase family protein [Nakamurella panacisegetis]SDO71240.1 carboxymethylenebutenolidase [Nakamurella panacisegetis]